MMTFDVLKQILSFLEEIRKSVKQGSGTITQLKEGLQNEQNIFSSPLAPDLLKDADSLEKSLALILSSEEHANQVAKAIQELISHSSTEKPEIKTVNLHTLLNNCVEQAIEKMRSKDDSFRFIVDKKFNRIVTNITALPWELAYAFDQFINHSLYSLKHKKEILGDTYEPKLEIDTLATNEGFEIVFKDNGRGVPEKKMQTFFFPFLENDYIEVEDGYGLSLAYYIIVNIHHGQIRVESEEGNFLHLTVALPRSPYPVNASHPQ
jgi:K+-sensing histidine kinase KdpD